MLTYGEIKIRKLFKNSSIALLLIFLNYALLKLIFVRVIINTFRKQTSISEELSFLFVVALKISGFAFWTKD